MNSITGILLTLIFIPLNFFTEQISFQEVNTHQLPLVVKPGSKDLKSPVFYFLSGDGGWNSFSNMLTDGLSGNGVPVVGLDSKKYFWTSKSPEEATEQLNKVIEDYNNKFQRDSLLIAGFSFGADVVPFIVNRLPESTRKRITKVVLISPDRFGDFEIHLSDMLNLGLSRRKYNVAEEVRKITFVTTTCIFGKNEEAADMNAFKSTGATVIILPGDHHYDNNIQLLVQTLIKVITHY